MFNPNTAVIESSGGELSISSRTDNVDHLDIEPTDVSGWRTLQEIAGTCLENKLATYIAASAVTVSLVARLLLNTNDASESAEAQTPKAAESIVIGYGLGTDQSYNWYRDTEPKLEKAFLSAVTEHEARTVAIEVSDSIEINESDAGKALHDEHLTAVELKDNQRKAIVVVNESASPLLPVLMEDIDAFEKYLFDIRFPGRHRIVVVNPNDPRLNCPPELRTYCSGLNAKANVERDSLGNFEITLANTDSSIAATLRHEFGHVLLAYAEGNDLTRLLVNDFKLMVSTKVQTALAHPASINEFTGIPSLYWDWYMQSIIRGGSEMFGKNEWPSFIKSLPGLGGTRVDYMSLDALGNWSAGLPDDSLPKEALGWFREIYNNVDVNESKYGYASCDPEMLGAFLLSGELTPSVAGNELFEKAVETRAGLDRWVQEEVFAWAVSYADQIGNPYPHEIQAMVDAIFRVSGLVAR